MTQHSPALPAGLAGLLCVLVACSGAAHGQASPALDRASLWIGGFDAHSSTVLRARAPDGSLYGDVRLERDLDFPRRDWTQRLRAEFLLGDHQGLSLDFFRYRRGKVSALDTRILYNGITYDTQASVAGTLGLDFGSVAYRWWLGEDEDVLGIGLGAGYYRVQARIRGQATVNGITGIAASSTNDNAWAPLLQMGWRHAFNRHWRLYLDASGVKKNGGRLHGHAYRAAFGAHWLSGQGWGVSAEYGLQRIRLWQHRARFDDSLDLKLDGPSIYATWRF